MRKSDLEERTDKTTAADETDSFKNAALCRAGARPGFWPVTRRDVLIGGGASFVTAPLAASEAKAYLDVTYEDRTRRGLVIAWVEPGQPYAWVLRSSTFTDPDLPNGRGRFVLRRVHDGWRADIAQCALPGGYAFGLRIDVKWDPSFDPNLQATPGSRKREPYNRRPRLS